MTSIGNNAPGCNSIEDVQNHCPALPRVISVSLINADSDQPIQVLGFYNELNLAYLPGNFNFQATTNSGSVGSVKLVLTGLVYSSGTRLSRTQVENQAPYALFGDQQGDYNPGNLPPGGYALEATVYSGPSATGTAITNFKQYFTVVNLPPGIGSFSLYNAEPDFPLQRLSEGNVLILASLPQQLNITANPNPNTQVGSVKLELTGPQNRTQVDNLPPYALFGDRDGNLNPWTPTPGNYTLTARSYTGPGATGKAEGAHTIHFRVVAQRPQARVASAEGVEDKALLLGVYPNPFSDSFTLELDEKAAGPVPVVLYNGSGQKVFEQHKAGSTQLIRPGSNVALGLYLLQVGEGSRAERRKLMKIP